MDEEQLKAIVRKLIKQELTIDLEEHNHSDYNERGFKVTIKLNEEHIADDYIYLN